MSTQAKKNSPEDIQYALADAGVYLIGGDLDVKPIA